MSILQYLGLGYLVYAALSAVVALLTGQFAFKHWLLQFFIGVLDQGANVLLTPFHRGTWADETLSCRAYRAYKDGRRWGRVWMPVIDWLFSWQTLPPGAIGHCHSAFIKERARYNSPPEAR